MKYALFILAVVFSFSASELQARTIYSFHHSDALTTVAQFLYDTAGDMETSYRISGKKIKVINTSKCIQVKASVALNDFEITLKKVMRFYPDEEIPFEQALIDMEDYLDGRIYTKCKFEKKKNDVLTTTSYYFDETGKIHFRIDQIATAE